MIKHKWILAVTSGLIVMALAAGATTFSTISNASARSANSASNVQDYDKGTQPEFQGPAGRPGVGENQELLAEALGISLEELQTAQEAAMKAALAQAVEKGLITQAQADEMSQREFSRLGVNGMRFGPDSEIDIDALLADQLGISVDTLHAAREQVRSSEIDQAVEDGTMTEEQAEMLKIQVLLQDYIRDAQQEAYKSAVAKAVADGVITQAQADLVLSNNIQGFGFGLGGPSGGPGGMGARPGRGPGSFGNPSGSQENTPAAPNIDSTGSES